MTLAAAVGGMVTRLATLSQLSRVYSDPPESLNQFPCAIAFSSHGEMTSMAAGGHSLHTLAVEIYQDRQQLPQAVDAAKQWPDLVYGLLVADGTLVGTVSHVVWPIRYRAGALRYGNNIYYGVRFEVTVKINEAT